MSQRDRGDDAGYLLAPWQDQRQINALDESASLDRARYTRSSTADNEMSHRGREDSAIVIGQFLRQSHTQTISGIIRRLSIADRSAVAASDVITARNSRAGPLQQQQHTKLGLRQGQRQIIDADESAGQLHQQKHRRQ